MQPAVRRDAHQSVLAALARPMVGLTDPDSGHAGPVALAAARAPLLPSEALGALGERLSQMSAGDGPLTCAVEGVRVGGVDAADGQLVDAQLGRGLVEQGLHRAGDLVLTGTALRAPRRGVGKDRNPAEAHCGRGVDDRDGAGGAVEVAEAAVGAVLLHDEEVDRGEAAITPESHADPALEAGARGADGVFFGAADAHHYRPARLSGHVGRHRHDRIGAALGAESAPAVFAHVDQVLGRDADVAGQAVQHRALALGRAEDVALAVLPVGHRRARFHRVVRCARGDEGLVEHHRCVAEAGFDIPVGPLRGDLPHGQVSAGGRGEVLLRPLHLRDALAALGGVALLAGVGAPGAQALQRIHHERQGLEVELHPGDGVLGRGFVHGGQRRDRLAHVVGGVGQDGVAGRLDFGHLVGGQDGNHPVHRECLRSVDGAHPRVGHGAGDEAAEEHAVGAEVLRVTGPSGDLAYDVRRREIPADQFSHWTPPPRRPAHFQRRA